MARIRAALVGCGRISGNHLEALQELADKVELVGVCDEIRERAEVAAGDTGAAVYEDYATMLDETRPDFVSICTPSSLHPAMGIVAAERGIHVVSEKPLGTALKAVDDLISACDRNRVRLFCVKQNRLNATMQLLKRAVEKGRFGRIYFAQVNVFWQRPQDYYDMAKWRGTWEFDGGAFMNQASHYVDALYWLAGEVESVMATTATLARSIEAEDTGSALLRFRSGAVGSVNVTMLAYPKNLEGSVTILGEKGSVKVGGIAINRFDHWEFADWDDDDKLVETSNYAPPNVYGFGHLAYYHHLLRVLEGEEEPETDGRAGRKSLEIILAIYRSAREGIRVPLPLQG